MAAPATPPTPTEQPHTPVVKYSDFTLSGSKAGLTGSGTPQQQAPAIRSSELEYFEQIGGGCFGKVYRGKCRGKIVGIKKLLKQELDDKALNDFIKEVEIMSHLRHPNCLLFMGACTEPGHMAIVMEYMPKGSIVGIIRNNPKLSMYRRLLMAKDTALGMNWLHCSDPQIIHRDLKPSNLLIDENWNVKVCDFGLSAVKPVGIDKLQDKDSIPGTPLWMAPEVMMGRPLDEKSDIYSFGICLWEIFTGEEPFSQYTSYPVFKKAICVKNERPPIRPTFHPAVIPLLEQCWDKDPVKRPSFAQILTMIDNIIIDCTISDRVANTFWRENFFGKVEVPWDVFSNKFSEALKVAPPVTNDLNFKCLKALTAEKSTEPGASPDSYTVNIEKLGNVLDWFGPVEYIQVEQKGKTLQTSTILEEIKNLMKQPWFHGAISKEEAETILTGQAKCTYLVRLSTTEPGGFTISKVTKDSKINHQRVHHTPGTQKFTIHINNNKGNKTVEHEARGGLEQIIKKVEGDLSLKVPCPGSKFRALFISADVQGYLSSTDY